MGKKKIYIGEFGDGKGPLLGLLRSPIFFLFDPVFSLPPPTPPPSLHYGAWSQASHFFFRFLFSVGVLLSAVSSRNLRWVVHL